MLLCFPPGVDWASVIFTEDRSGGCWRLENSRREREIRQMITSRAVGRKRMSVRLEMVELGSNSMCPKVLVIMIKVVR
jgi:hypothetical protein